MSFAPGSRLGVYEIVSPLGAGGMGEVYRARDTRLHRDVALKILPDVFASDPERLARFEREAQALAALKHPHIATIYGIIDAGSAAPFAEPDAAHTGRGSVSARALVLELVEGQTLADRIAQGPLPADEAVRIARQVADALEAAHEQGIVHRDLKPANVQITPDGSIKVLDFGLAKLGAAHDTMSGSSGLSMSPTMTSPAMLTQATVLLGTAAYMAPEQARGKPSDKRADIWAFGVLLYEMLTGARAFEGESVTETAGAVIHKDPDWGALPATLPPTIRMVVRRCLQKDPKQRFRDIGDVRLALEGAFAPEPAAAAPGGVPPRGRRTLAFAAVAAIALAFVAAAGVSLFMRGEAAPAAAPVRFDLMPAPPEALTPIVAVSPDGRMINFVALDEDGVPRLRIHELGSGENRIIAPSETVRGPGFWSPDSRYLAFLSGGRLKKVDVTGGPVETVAAPPSFAGGTWGPGDVIVFSAVTGIYRVPASGGEPVALTAVDEARNETAHVVPWFLPDGRHFLYLRYGSVETPNGIYVGAIDAEPGRQDLTRLIATDSSAVYAPAEPGRGHVLFVRDGVVVAQPFDERELTTTGTAVPVTTDRVELTNVVLPSLSASSTVLAYRRSGALAGRMMAIDRAGTPAPIPGVDVERAQNPRVSPDGTRLALVTGSNLWVYHLDGRPPIRLTFSEDPVYSPIWTRDGRRLVYEQGGVDGPTIFSLPADGSAREPQPAAPDGHFHPHGWTNDGLLLAGRIEAGRADLVRLQPSPAGTVEDVVATQGNEGFGGSVSPDGRWLAYDADSTGRGEIWIRPVAGGAPVRVSPNGGSEPVWSKTGRELYYLEDRTMMAVPVATGGELRFDAPVELFTVPMVASEQPPSYDVTADGRFIMMVSDESAQIPISVILNWTGLLADRTAAH